MVLTCQSAARAMHAPVCREVGSVCSPTSIKVADGDGESSQRAYIVTLLKDGNKTLAECFPNIKLGPKKK